MPFLCYDSRLMTTKEINCAFCGKKWLWPKMFPNSTYAECWECFWKHHCEQHHKPKKKWRVRSPFYRDI